MPSNPTVWSTLSTRAYRPIRAVLTDVDGTLYRQSLLRRRLTFELFCAYLLSPRDGWRAAKALQAYRRSQEILRAERFHGDVAGEQLRRACLFSKLPQDLVTRCIDEWMEQRPLKLLRATACLDMPEFFGWCRGNDIRLAVVSDYDPRRKLRALGVAQYFDTVVFAQDPEVGRLKPDPRGLQIALERLGVKPQHALYVGDREDVDVTAAQRAGVSAVLMKPNWSHASADYISVRSFADLRGVIEDDAAKHRRTEDFCH